MFQLHCCGLFSYTDWEGRIPESCMCGPVEEEEGLCRQVQVSSAFTVSTLQV